MSDVEKEKGVVNKAKKAKKLATTIDNIVKFFITPIGQIIGWIILAAILLLLLLIILRTFQRAIAKLFGIDMGAVDVSGDYAVLQGINAGGYGSLLSPEELNSYLDFEYGVLMDVAKNIEETGVYEGINVGQSDLSGVSLDQYLGEVASRLGGGSGGTFTPGSGSTSRSGETAQPPSGTESAPGTEDPTSEGEEAEQGVDLGGTDDYQQSDVKTAFPEEIIYKYVKNPYTNDVSMMPYLVITRTETTETYYITGSNTNASSPDHYFPFYYNAALNQNNVLFQGKLPTGEGAGDFSAKINENSSKTLFITVSEPKTIIYEIPLRVLIDKYMPKASLLSSWYMLKNEQNSDFDINVLIQDIKNVYNKACLEGETGEKKLKVKNAYIDLNGTLQKQKIITTYKDGKATNNIYGKYTTIVNGEAINIKEDKINDIKLLNLYIETPFSDAVINKIAEENINDQMVQATFKVFDREANGDYKWVEIVEGKDYNVIGMTGDIIPWFEGEYRLVTDPNTGFPIRRERQVYLGEITFSSTNDGFRKTTIKTEGELYADSDDKTYTMIGAEIVDPEGITNKFSFVDFDRFVLEANYMKPWVATSQKLTLFDSYITGYTVGARLIGSTESYKKYPNLSGFKQVNGIEVVGENYPTDPTAATDKYYDVSNDDGIGVSSSKIRSLRNAAAKQLVKDMARAGVIITVDDVETKVTVVPIFTVSTVTISNTMNIERKYMPMYLIRNLETWSKSTSFKNIVRQDGFPGNWQYLTPKSKYGRGFTDLKILEESPKYRLDMFEDVMKVTRENGTIAMLLQWEEQAEQGETSAYTFMREMYKIINYMKIKTNSSGEPYIGGDAYKYLHIPEDVLEFNDSYADKIFWLEKMGVDRSDPLSVEEQNVMRGKKETVTWQNVEYEKYPECQITDSATGEVTGAKVYALWPLGNPYIRAMYTAESMASATAAYKVLSWGWYKPGGGHSGVDLYARYHMNEFITSHTGSMYFHNIDSGSMAYNYELNRLKAALNSEDKAKEKIDTELRQLEKYSPILAVAPGIVVDCRYSATSGFRVKIQHEKGNGYSGGTTTFYCHFKRWPLVQVGDYVGAGTVIGYEGTTGASAGNHLHFEISNDNDGSYGSVFPIPYLYPMFTPFYYAEKADEAKQKGLLGSEYLSLLRTIVIDDQVYDPASIPTLESTIKFDVFLGDGTKKTIGFKTIERESDGTPKQKNYVPTVPLLDDINNLVTIDQDAVFELETEGVGQIETKEYSGSDVSPLSTYFADPGTVEVEPGNGGVSDITFKYNFDTNKPLIRKNTYSEADYLKLEEILRQQVDAAGRGTRAGVVAAARFLAGLDYAVPYRGKPMDRPNYIGAYNKYGLNRTWGKTVRCENDRDYGGAYYGTYGINGLDCGAFVTWAFINGGVKQPGFAGGASIQGYGSHLYKAINIVDQIQVGDILINKGMRDGVYQNTHIGLIIGIKDDTIYIAESTTGRYNKLVVTTRSISGIRAGNYPHLYFGPVDKAYTARNPDGTEDVGKLTSWVEGE